MPYKQTRLIPSWHVEAPNERSLKVMLTPQRDAPCAPATVILSTLFPHTGKTGPHSHVVDEIMYIISGYGEGEEAGVTYEIEPGMLIHAPAGVEHDLRNLGDETMQIYCVFIPPLPDEVVDGIIANARPRLTK